jgi:hypothetical protein
MLCDLVSIPGTAQEDAAIIFKVQEVQQEWRIALYMWIYVRQLVQCMKVSKVNYWGGEGG